MENEVTKAEASKAVAKTGHAQVPDYVRNHQGGSGLQGMEAGDFIIPRIKLLQDGKKEPATFEAAKLGEFWINVIDVPLGPTFDFIVCSNRKRVLLLRPMDDKSGNSILARADDGVNWASKGEWSVKVKNVRDPVKWVINDLNVRRSGLLEFGTSNPGDPDSNPAATLFYEYLVYLPQFPDYSPTVLSCARTAAKRARDLNGKIEFRKAPVQSQVFRASVSKEAEGSSQEYFNYVFASNGFADEETFEKCKDIGQRYGNYKAADEEGAAAEGEANKAPVDRGEV